MSKMGYDLHLNARVQELLDDGTLDEVFKLLEDDLRQEIFATAPADSEERERIYHEMHGLGRLRIKMEVLLNDLRSY